MCRVFWFSCLLWDVVTIWEFDGRGRMVNLLLFVFFLSFSALRLIYFPFSFSLFPLKDFRMRLCVCFSCPAAAAAYVRVPQDDQLDPSSDHRVISQPLCSCPLAYWPPTPLPSIPRPLTVWWLTLPVVTGDLSSQACELDWRWRSVTGEPWPNGLCPYCFLHFTLCLVCPQPVGLAL